MHRGDLFSPVDCGRQQPAGCLDNVSVLAPKRDFVQENENRYRISNCETRSVVAECEATRSLFLSCMFGWVETCETRDAN